MNFSQALSEKILPITGKTRLGKKYRMYRGITYLVLGEEEPPDVHGIPKDMEAYGRGWFSNDQIFVDGGPGGSSQGHPSDAKDAFYWAADYDKVWTSRDGEKRKGAVYIRGRAGTSTHKLEKNVLYILDKIYRRLPK